jgi:hypothetical protein
VRAAQQQVIHGNEITNTFTHKDYNVTSYWCCLLAPFGAPFKSTLNLEPEFVVTEDTDLYGINRRRVAYGEMSVDRLSFCCFVGINQMSPKCGCDNVMVNDICF